MTSGKLFPQLLRFILPVIASNLLQTTYNMADTVVAGLSSEPNAVGAVGGCAAFTGFVINAFIGCSVGSKVIMARALGERDDRKIAETFRTSLFLSVILGFLCGGIGFCLSGKVLALMGNHGRLYELALTYTRIYFLGTPFISACNRFIVCCRKYENAHGVSIRMRCSQCFFEFVLCIGLPYVRGRSGVGNAPVKYAVCRCIGSVFVSRKRIRKKIRRFWDAS